MPIPLCLPFLPTLKGMRLYTTSGWWSCSHFRTAARKTEWTKRLCSSQGRDNKNLSKHGNRSTLFHLGYFEFQPKLYPAKIVLRLHVGKFSCSLILRWNVFHLSLVAQHEVSRYWTICSYNLFHFISCVYLSVLGTSHMAGFSKLPLADGLFIRMEQTCVFSKTRCQGMRGGVQWEQSWFSASLLW